MTWPFYGAYIIVELDKDYQYALISGPDKSYLWILARTPMLDPVIRDRLIARVKALGFDASKLIFVDQSPS